MQWRAEPNEVTGLGLYTGGAYILSDLWDSAWLSEISIDLNMIRYSQEEKRRFRRQLSTTVPMTTLTFGFTQDVTSSLQATFSYSSYSYGSTNVETLSNAINNRPNVSIGLLQLIQGLPRSNGSLGLIWRTGDWTWIPSFSFTQLAFDEKQTGWSFQGDYQWTESWGMTGEATFSSVESDSTNLFGVGLFFYW